MKESKTILYVGKYFLDKAEGLVLLSTDEDLVKEFKDLCWTTLSNELHWFHQSNCNNFQFFECWSDKPILLRQEAKRIANKLSILLKEVESPL